MKKNIHASQEPFNESLKIISYCPLCDTNYNPLTAEILERRENAHLMYIRCKKCLSSIVAVVVTGVIGVSSIGLVTDLTVDDVMKFQNAEKLSNDDVLDVYEQSHGSALVQRLMNGSGKNEYEESTTAEGGV